MDVDVDDLRRVFWLTFGCRSSMFMTRPPEARIGRERILDRIFRCKPAGKPGGMALSRQTASAENRGIEQKLIGRS
jgi:hypothetical protein